MKALVLVMSLTLLATSAFASAIADSEGSVPLKGKVTNAMIFEILQSLKSEGNPSVYASEDGDAAKLQLASEVGTLTCTQSEGFENGQVVESLVECDVNVD